MHRCTATAWLLLALLGAHAHAVDQPRRALVTAAEAEVRSGPSLQFYATDRLINGSEVEVYKQTSNGWCAIRPPEGSFSYIPKEAVRPTSTAEVVVCVQSGIKTRVGSKLDNRLNVQYVALQVGERLHVLSSPIRLGKDQREWYRISPPSGEFRWMRTQDLRIVAETNSELPLAAAPEPVEPAPLPPGISDNATPLAVATSPPPVPADPSSGSGSESLATTTIPLGSRGRMETTPIPAAPPAATVISAPERQSVQPVSHAQIAGIPRVGAEADDAAIDLTAVTRQLVEETSADSAWTAVPDGVSSDPTWELAELELQLSQQVTRDVESWQLSSIAARARALAGKNNDLAIRSDAQRLLQRTQEFAALQRRHQTLLGDGQRDGISLVSAVTSVPPSELGHKAAAGSYASPMPSALLPGTRQRRGSSSLDPRAIARNITSAVPTNMSAAAQANSGFAGRGWLVPVITTRTDLPRFALTDEKGRVTSFVAAVPGLNLRRYERHEVGIVGKSQMATQRDSSYLLAERIIVLDR